MLGLSLKTVEAHKFNLMRKLDIHNKAGTGALRNPEEDREDAGRILVSRSATRTLCQGCNIRTSRSGLPQAGLTAPIPARGGAIHHAVVARPNDCAGSTS